MKKKLILSKVIEVFAAFLVLLILNNVFAGSYILFLGIGFVIALTYAGVNFSVLNLGFVLVLPVQFFLFKSLTPWALLFNVSSLLLFDLIYFCYLRRNKVKNINAFLITFVVCVLPLFAFVLPEWGNVLKKFVGILISSVWTSSVMHLAKKLKLNKTKLTFNIFDTSAMIVFLILIGVALSQFAILKVEVGFAFALICLLFISRFNKPFITLFLAVALGVGFYITAKNADAILYFASITFILTIVSKFNKFIAAAFFFVFCFCFSLFFNADALRDYIFFAILFVLTICITLISNKQIKMITNKLTNKNEKLLTESFMFASFKQILKTKLLIGGESLFELARLPLFKNNQKLNDTELARAIFEELKIRTCESCNSNKNCRLIKSTDEKIILEAIERGIIKGKISIIDFPSSMNSNCNKLNILINEINTLLVRALDYKNNQNKNNEVATLFSSEIETAAKSFYNMAGAISSDYYFDEEKTNELKFAFDEHNLRINEVSVIIENGEVLVFIEALEDGFNEMLIEKITSSLMRRKMQISSINQTENNGIFMKLTASPKLDLVFGSASEKKHLSPASGDNFSVIKIDGNKFLIGICDGRGSGNEANKFSSNLISIFENYIKAGENELTTVNKLNKIFASGDEEAISSLDFGFIDLSNESCNFIKFGAPISFIKRKEIIKIENENLPFASLATEEAKGDLKQIKAGDIIIFVSDGITDAFKTTRELENFINNSKTINPKELADEILEEAISLDKSLPSDDMTVLVVRIFKR
jgi:stage II sporulation protein E